MLRVMAKLPLQCVHFAITNNVTKEKMNLMSISVENGCWFFNITLNAMLKWKSFNIYMKLKSGKLSLIFNLNIAFNFIESFRCNSLKNSNRLSDPLWTWREMNGKFKQKRAQFTKLTHSQNILPPSTYNFFPYAFRLEMIG